MLRKGTSIKFRINVGRCCRPAGTQATKAAPMESHVIITTEKSVLSKKHQVASSESANIARALDEKASDKDYSPSRLGLLIKKPKGFSFGGGPGAVRDIVRERAAAEIRDGSLLEMSHREVGEIQKLLVSTQALFRDLLAIPSNYDILFMQGGAHAQFSAVPLNFGSSPKSVSLISGSWSAKATMEQRKFSSVLDVDVRSGFKTGKDMLQSFETALNASKVDYGYMCSNETMQGSQFRNDALLPRPGPSIISDSTSDLLSRRIDISRYGVVFASGGKNLGPAGFAVVIVNKDILAREPSSMCPSFMNWREYANSTPVQNIYQTPPMVSLGISKMVLDDLAARGGLAWAEQRTQMLSGEIYKEIDSSRGFYSNNVPRDLRSNVSVVFGIPASRELETKFVKTAETRGLLQLVNHPSVGGMRASLYNAVPVQAVEELTTFMRDFRRAHDN